MLLVTGGGGFIGSVLGKSLNDAGYEDIVIVDDFGTSEKWRNVAKRQFIDILPISTLLDWLECFGQEVTTIFHLGANSSTTATDADAIIGANINTSMALWRWCTRHGTKLIYASSAATYGDGTLGFDDCAGIGAMKRLRPLNLYGWSKHAFDLQALREAACGRQPTFWAGLKFFSVFGPNEYHKGSLMSLVARNYRKVMAGEPVTLFRSAHPGVPDGGQQRDFVYVKDCAAVMVWLMERGRDSGIFNLGTGESHSFRELTNVLGTACGIDPVIEYVDVPAAIRQHFQIFTKAPMTKLRHAGYAAPFRPFEEAVREYVTCHLACPDPYL
jgi:ADP-L-glycero-D-manno-heptose 6-epimerase